MVLRTPGQALAPEVVLTDPPKDIAGLDGALPALGIGHASDMMRLGLAVGMLLTIPIFALVFSRLVLEPPLPVALEPSLLIPVAPFAVNTSTYVATTGAVDLFAKSLCYLTDFLLAVLAGRLRHLTVCCPFKVGW